MTTSRQFWTLFKLQPAINPTIYFMPLAFATPLLMPLFMQSSHDYHPTLGILFSSQNTFFILFFGVLWFAPELFGKTNAKWSSGTEFLVTRAIDRAILYRARLSAFYLAVAIIPMILFISATQEPDLQIRESLPANQQEILTHIPGSTGIPKKDSAKFDNILIPNGSYLATSYNLWRYLLWAIGTQLLISLVISLKHRNVILWSIWGVIIFVPLALSIIGTRSTLRTIKSDRPIDTIVTLGWSESLFLQFVHYQPVLWIATAITLVTVHLWCERRFARAEY